MKYGITLSTFPTQFGPIVFAGKAVDENLKTIKDLGYQGVDLFVHQMSDAELDDLDALLQKHGLEATMMAAIWFAETGLSLSEPDPQTRKQYVELFESQIDRAARLHTDMPVGFIRGKRLPDEELSAYHERLAESLKKLTEYATPKSVTLLLEPINRYEINTFHRIGESVEFIEKHRLRGMKLLIDLFHMNIEESSLEGAIESARGYIGHVHITDTNRLAPGQGHLDYETIIAALKRVGYEGYLTIEAFPEPNPYDCAKSGIEYLRQYL